MVRGVIMLREMFLAVAILFLTSGVFTNAQKSAETVVSVGLGAPLTVECGLRVEQRAEWLLDGGAVPADMRAAGEQAGAGEARLTARLHAAHARAQHAGLYTCSREPGAPRVRVHVTRAAPPAEPPRSAPAGAAEEESATGFPILYFDLHRNLTLNCTSPDADKAATYEWKKNELPLEQVPQLKDRYRLDEGGAVLALKAKTNEEDYGNYTCVPPGGPPRGWEVRARPLARLPANTNVVEGQKLKLQCKIIGKPYPRITWTYAASEDDNASQPILGSGRWRLESSEQGVPDAALALDAAERADAGVYACHAQGGGSDQTTLRVKDMYAALWPFLGICAEVFVLCAIILVYEKRRTKPELEDSDTDNHDQKKS